MCLVAVYTQPAGSPGRRTLVLSDVAFIECSDDRARVTDLFGRSETLQARVRFIDTMKNEVVLEQGE